MVIKASFLIFLTSEDDTNHTPTLHNTPDDQTPGFISLMIRAGGQRAIVNTVMNPMSVHVMRGISTMAKKLQASQGGIYSVEWLRSCPTHGCCADHHQRHVLWADIRNAA
jgi:hypothetical protein